MAIIVSNIMPIIVCKYLYKYSFALLNINAHWQCFYSCWMAIIVFFLAQNQFTFIVPKLPYKMQRYLAMQYSTVFLCKWKYTRVIKARMLDQISYRSSFAFAMLLLISQLFVQCSSKYSLLKIIFCNALVLCLAQDYANAYAKANACANILKNYGYNPGTINPYVEMIFNIV